MNATIGVTAQQRLVIRCVGANPRVSAAELATALHLDPGTVSVTLARLARDGFVRRKRDPVDARRSTLELTVAGHAINRPSPGTVESAVDRPPADCSQVEHHEHATRARTADRPGDRGAEPDWLARVLRRRQG